MIRTPREGAVEGLDGPVDIAAVVGSHESAIGMNPPECRIGAFRRVRILRGPVNVLELAPDRRATAFSGSGV